MTAGLYTVEIFQDGYEDYSTSVQVSSASSGYCSSIETNLVPIQTPTPTPTPDISYIKIYSNPSGASVYVDGNYEGITASGQYFTISTSSGSHTVEISKAGYEDYSTSVQVLSGQYSYITTNLVPIIGQIAVVSDPPGAAIYIDENYVGTTISGYYKIFTVQTGSHVVKVVRSSPSCWYRADINVNFGETTYVVVTSDDWI